MRATIAAWISVLVIVRQGLCLDLAPETFIKYANGLAEREEYRAAAEEYYRTLSYFPSSRDDSDMVEGMLKLAEKSEDYHFTVRLAQQLENSNYSNVDKCLARYYRGRSLYWMGRHGGALMVLDLPNGCPPEVSAKGQYYVGLTYLRMRAWDDAGRVFEKLDAGFPFPDYKARALETAHDGPKLRFRSPGIAGMVSFVLPGGGYFYAGSPKSGLAALLTVGMLSWGAISSFRSNNNGPGVVFSILGIGWHFGGVYGSAQAARRYNEYLADKLIGGVEIP